MSKRTIVLSVGVLTLMALPHDADAFWYARGWRGGVAVGGFRPPAVVAPYYLNGCLRCAPYYHPALAARAAAMAGGAAAAAPASGGAAAPAAAPPAPATAAPPSTTAVAAPSDQGGNDDGSGASNSGGSTPAAAPSSAASSGKDKASACAAGLSKDSKAIYDATAPHVTSLSTLKDTVVTETRQLLMSGKIVQASAKSSAQAAGKCLELLAGN